MIELVNSIIHKFVAAGFNLTLRQIYYQLVKLNAIKNESKSYDNLGSLVNNARLAGLIDWDHVVDRTRGVKALSHWDKPQDILSTAAEQFRIDRWDNQPRRVEVWIEKDTLANIVEGVCQENDIPYFSCRGYTSQSEMWAGARRLLAHTRRGQPPLILHIGDHDPSGKDMTRDITDRMKLFMGGTEIERIALNMDQIEQYNPPENPAKITDSRSQAYIEEFGNSSWEIEALEPNVIIDLIQEQVDLVRDPIAWEESGEEQEAHKRDLALVTEHWDRVSQEYLPTLDE